jgi:hypothetical protein
MAAPILTVEPQWIYAGDTLLLTKSLADYPANDGWTLSYFFVSDDGSGKSFTIPSTSNGTAFSISFNTTSVEVGKYQGRAKVVKSGQTFTVWAGTIEVLPSLESAGDNRTQARKTLDAIEAVILGRASSTIMESIVEGTRLNRISHVDLLKLRDRYKQIVLNEEDAARRAQGLPSRKNIYITFGNP